MSTEIALQLQHTIVQGKEFVVPGIMPPTRVIDERSWPSAAL
jgi:hypothetical protein